MTRFSTHLALLFAAVALSLSSCTALEEEIPGGLDGLDSRLQEEPFSLDHHALPENRSWLECPGGGNEGLMQTIGQMGGSLALSAGHVLHVENGALADRTDFAFVEPRSRHIVVDASAGVKTVAPQGFRLVVRWGQRPSCTVPADAVPVLFRVVPGGEAEPVGRRRSPEDDFIEATVDSLSTFAIAT